MYILNIAFRHPHLFRKVAAFSGRYDLPLDLEHFRDLFNGHRDEQVYFHTPTQYLPNLGCPGRLDALRRMDILPVIGKDDPFLDNNPYLSRGLRDKGVWHALHEWDGRGHQGFILLILSEFQQGCSHFSGCGRFRKQLLRNWPGTC